MKISRKVKKMLKVLGIAGLSACLFVGNPCMAADITRATINMNDPNDPMRVPDSDAFYAVDVSTSGTNTTNNHIVKATGIGYVAIQLHVGSVSVGSIGFGLEQSLDGVTWGSVTASQMVRLTDTLVSSNALGSKTAEYYVGDYFGSHTQYLGSSTTFGSQSFLLAAANTPGTNTLYVLRAIGDWIRVKCTHTTSGTDTARYKVVLKKVISGKI